MITLYILDGCPYCEGFKDALDELGIEHRAIMASGNPEADELEDLLNTYYYPIVKIDGKQKPIFIISDGSPYPRVELDGIDVYYYESSKHLLTTLLKLIYT